ncbi:hypothetical protein LI82_05045 [Methanococcoides methylutens]|uniref:Uncharacterized protein n=1 Tax=Methanococcoides methylutens TaxID=2226 RepID=A0A099T2M4_METMT|nr:hypothetical protein [Methanococcoides methylutens]KGK99372.1 hypothetical protein LI82_05045 [Methanococcoides methylutens]
MRIPKFKLLGGIVLVLVASFLPSVFLTDVLSSTTDTVIGGFNLAGVAVQFGVILIGAVGASMIKDTLLRDRGNKRRY